MQNRKTGMIAMVIGLVLLAGCKNRDINEGEAFQPREIHENISFHFDKVSVDGIEYLILEKDNNNPHEGFGFMAFRANKLMAKQDSVLAYLKTLTDLQVRTYAAATRRSVEDVQVEANELLEFHLGEETKELKQLESSDLQSKRTPDPETETED